MNILNLKNNCVGCCLCENYCPVDAITIVLDNGFYRPVVNDVCIDCDTCVNDCPENKSVGGTSQTDDIYMAKGTSAFWDGSKSGGMFPILAKYFIDNGWWVCGAVFDDDMNVKHILSNEWDDVEKMRGSKYVQSNLNGVFKSIKEKLKEGIVLFSGTPCQVHALKSFIGNNDNLYTIDLWCNGTGSPELWKSHLTTTFGDRLPKKVSYGNKETGKVSQVVYTFDDGEKRIINTKDDDFYKSLLNFKKNPSCIDCRYSQITRMGDFTIGDFWYVSRNPGFEKYCVGKIPPSFIMFNTEKSKTLIDFVKINSVFFKKIDFDKIISNNRWGIIKNFKQNVR